METVETAVTGINLARVPVAPRPNPYVGPKPLQSCDRLYGRDCELRDLCDLLIAERLVLLYSPSGAGKSSLINAGLVELLRTTENFRVLPTLRVNLRAVEGEENVNRYVNSVRECLLTGLEHAQREAMMENTVPSLADFIGQRPRCDKDGPADSKFEVLIFDQFEEVCSLDPTDRDKKEQFFGELREVLRSRNRWALFVIREDYLAEIDSFSHLLPTALATRFRLNLLSIEQAREAIAGPAEAAGRPFPREKIAQLVAELATVTVQSGDALLQTVGANVEPVQLQVVCRRLWQRNMEGQHAAVDEMASGAVNEALRVFYEDAVALCAQRSGTSQRQIRNWIESNLIVKPAMRNQIMRMPEETLGLDDACVAALVDEHLLRFDRRAGREWIEITHDRMIPPILSSNEQWRDVFLQPFQQQAALWEAGNRGANMLLSAERFDEAEQWRVSHPGEVNATELAYLKESREALDRAADLAQRNVEMAQRAEEMARSHRKIGRQRSFIVAGSALACCAMLGAVMHFRVQEKMSYIDKLNGQALALPQGQYELTLRYALRAYDIWNGVRWRVPLTGGVVEFFQPAENQRMLRNIHAALLAGLLAVPPTETRLGRVAGHMAAVRQLAFHPSRRLLASASADGAVLLWDLSKPDAPMHRFVQRGKANTVAFNAAGDLLAMGADDGTVQVWRIAAPAGTGAVAVGPMLHSFPHAAEVMVLAFKDESVLAAALRSGDIVVRDLSLPRIAPVLLHPAGGRAPISAMVFIDRGKLVTGDLEGTIRTWSLSGDAKATAVQFHKSNGGDGFGAAVAVTALAYDLEHDRLAASGWIRPHPEAPKRSALELWNQVSTTPTLDRTDSVSGSDTSAYALAFSANGNVLAYSGGESRSVSIADVSMPVAARSEQALPGPLRFQERLFSAAFAPYVADRGRLLAIGGGADISLVNLNQAGPLPTRQLALDARLGTRTPREHQAALSADGRSVVMGAGSMLSIQRGTGTPLSGYASGMTSGAGVAALHALDISSDGALVAVAGAADEPVRLIGADGSVHALPDSLCASGKAPVDAPVRSLKFAPSVSNAQLAVATGNAWCVLDVAKPTAPRRVDGGASGTAPIRAIAYSGDGKQLAFLEGDATLRLPGARAGSHVFQAPASTVSTIAFTSHPNFLAAGTSDADIWILDIAGGRWSRLDPLHDSEIDSLHFAFSNGVELMVSADIDGRLMLWEKIDTTYRRLGRPLTSKSTRTPVALSRNGELLLVGGANARMFDLRLSSLVAMACSSVDSHRYKACAKGSP